MVMETGTRLARTLSHAAKHPGHVGVLWSKFLAHLDGSYVGETRRRGAAFARAHAIMNPEECVAKPVIWREAQEFGSRLAERAEIILNGARAQFGGGGFSTLLYYLTRAAAPKTIVETGVAAGWSSASFLTALHRNGFGRLWSSDFPYFDRTNKPEDIGLLVPADLRGSWRLFTNGDRINLPKIVNASGPIDLFHYDSDKTYRGRSFALDLVRPHLAPGALTLFDDIQDNEHFADFIAAEKPPFLVFECGGKYVGVIGETLDHYFDIRGAGRRVQ